MKQKFLMLITEWGRELGMSEQSEAIILPDFIIL